MPNKACPACGERIKEDALRCKHCGTDLPLKKCPWCAEIIDEEARKCKHCKSYVDKIRCGACSRHVEAASLICAECAEEHITEQVTEQLDAERLKLRAWNIAMIAVAVIAVVWGFLQ
jgi:hypothetical protein